MSLNSAYLNQPRYKILSSTDNFGKFGQVKIMSHFADFGQVKIISKHFFLTLSKPKILTKLP